MSLKEESDDEEDFDDDEIRNLLALSFGLVKPSSALKAFIDFFKAQYLDYTYPNNDAAKYFAITRNAIHVLLNSAIDNFLY